MMLGQRKKECRRKRLEDEPGPEPEPKFKEATFKIGPCYES